MTDADIEQLAHDIDLLQRSHKVHDHVLERLAAGLPNLAPRDPGKLGQEDPWSSLGPNTGTLAVTGGSTIPANYIRREIELSLDSAVTSVVYGLLNPGSGPGQSGTPSATNFHFALFANQPPFTTSYTGAIGLVASTGTIHVGVVEH